MFKPNSKAPEPLGLVRSYEGQNRALSLANPSDVHGEYTVFNKIEPLLDYWETMCSQKWLLFLITLLGIIIAIAITSLIEPRYRATTILELQNLNEDFLNFKNVSPTSSNTFQSPDMNIRTQATVLISRPVLERTLEKMDIQTRLLRRKPSKLEPLLGFLREIRKPAKADLPREVALKGLIERLEVRNEAGARIIKIGFDANDGQLAADVANAIANSYIELNMEKRWQSSKSVSVWLNRQLEDSRKNLRYSEEALQRFAAGNNMTILSETDNPAEEGLRQLQTEISKAQADRIVKQSQYELASKAPDESLPEVLDDPTLREYQVQLTGLRQQLAELSTALTRGNPKVTKIEAQIAALASALQKKKEFIISRIQNEYRSAERRENLLVSEYKAQLNHLSKQSNNLSHYLSLKREVDSNRQLYDSLFQKVKEAEMVSLLRASDINVTETAIPSREPYTPSRFLNSAMGAMIGLCFGGWIAIRKAQTQLKEDQPGDISILLGTRELGIIPAIEKESGRRKRWLSQGSSQSTLSLSSGPIEMIAWKKGISPAADSYRYVLASILMAQRDGTPLKAFSITSTMPGEGKTTVTCNLAISLAKIGNRVLLIDGDMHRPRLHSVFATDNRVGISRFLQDDDSERPTETKVPGLFLIPSNTNEDPQLLFSSKFQELLQRFKNEFDMILVDCPPLLQMPDARLICRQVDAAILVIAQHTPQSDVVMASHRLQEDGTNLLGTIFNNWKFSNRHAGGYYRYGYYNLNDFHKS